MLPSRARAPLRTVFLQADAAWSYAAADDAAPHRFEPATLWVAAHADERVRLVLSGALTHQLVVNDAALPLADADAVVAWARHQFVHYHGAAAQHWAIAPWHQAGQRGASASHGLDVAATLRAAQEHAVKVQAVQPWWAMALRAATRDAPGLTVQGRAELWLVEALQATRVVCVAGRVASIEQHWLAAADEAALAAALATVGSDAATAHVLGYGLAPTAGRGLAAQRLGGLCDAWPAARWVAL